MVPASCRYEHGGATFRLFVNGVSGDAFGIEQRSLVGEAWSAVSAVGRSLKQLEQRCEWPGSSATAPARCSAADGVPRPPGRVNRTQAVARPPRRIAFLARPPATAVGPQSIMTGGLLLLRVVGSLAARLLLSPPFFVAAVVGTFFYGSWLK